MGTTTTEMRAPYVRFERRAVEDRTNEIRKGKYGFKDRDMALVTVAGQKDTHEKWVDEWLPQQYKYADDGRIPIEWPIHFEKAYKYWQSGQEMPLEGTPIKGWALLQPSQQQNLILHGIMTVEDLANINEEASRAIGMGGQGLKLQAQAWLKEAESTGTLAAQNASLQRDVESQGELIKKQGEQIQELMGKLQALLPPPPVKKDF